MIKKIMALVSIVLGASICSATPLNLIISCNSTNETIFANKPLIEPHLQWQLQFVPKTVVSENAILQQYVLQVKLADLRKNRINSVENGEATISLDPGPQPDQITNFSFIAYTGSPASQNNGRFTSLNIHVKSNVTEREPFLVYGRSVKPATQNTAILYVCKFNEKAK